MASEPRPPSPIPVRGTIGLVGTVGALAFLVSMRMPATPAGVALVAADDEAPASREGIGRTQPPEPAEELLDVRGGGDRVTATGAAIETERGAVQVVVTLHGDAVVDVVALALPDGDRRSAAISEYVEPILRERAITTDSADVDVVSGATYTSQAYAASLQSALDQLDGPGRPADVLVEPAEPTDVPAVPAEPADVPAVPAEPADVPARAAGQSDPVTLVGDPVAIRWGDVQVAVTLQGDDIIDVEALEVPGDRRSASINDRALPILRQQAVSSDSADVDVVSGATYTSRAYARSLQSALDQLGA